MRNLETALEAQRSFWRFMGIMAVVVIVAYIVFLGTLLFIR
jgi:hypothetical protein